MIKSEFKSFKFRFILITALFWLFMATCAIINYSFGWNIMNVKSTSSLDAFYNFIGFLSCALLFGFPLYRFAKIVSVDTESHVITTRNLFTGFQRTYHFEEFVGYIRMQRRDITRRDPHYNILFLVQTNQKTLRLSSFYYSNMYALSGAIKEIPYLGKQKYSIIKDLSFSFGEVTIT